jgi:asparagine synthase (glutamine-hydrolysing)
MCGIAGLLEPRLTSQRKQLAAAGLTMAEALSHRGPDGQGIWIDDAAGLVLAHRRLAIIDLSPAGDQPMMSADGRWVIAYNGEVYNTEEIAQAPELQYCNWRGHSDTEVILESFARRGLEKTLADLNGMFAIALWDRADRELYLIRDQLGIKPLYVFTDGGRVAFASELKSFARLDRWRPTIDAASLTSFFRFGCVPAPYSIFHGVSKLMPGEVWSVRPGAEPKRRRYWSAAEVAYRGMQDPLEISDGEAIEQFEHLLQDAVSRQMISDVPIGAFLSGGIDSSMVSALMVRAGRGPVRTFSMGSHDLNFDESCHAAVIARHLGTVHTEMTITANDALKVIPSLPSMYDEPFADSSQIPTHLISKLTRRHVTVALSGDGGDEILGGYNRHIFVERYWKYLAHVPRPLRYMTARMVGGMWSGAMEAMLPLVPLRARPAHVGEKLHKLTYIIPADPEQLYTTLLSLCLEPSQITNVAERKLDLVPGSQAQPGNGLSWTQLMDMMLYLPDDILQKVDRASMAVSLEVRPPLLDRRVVEWTWRLNNRFKIRHGESKWLLRRVLERYVPRPLFERPKMGFSVPLDSWLRGPLRKWSEDLLDPALFGGGLLNAAAVRSTHQRFLKRQGVSAHAVWTLLMFEAWRRQWVV